MRKTLAKTVQVANSSGIIISVTVGTDTRETTVRKPYSVKKILVNMETARRMDQKGFTDACVIMDTGDSNATKKFCADPVFAEMADLVRKTDQTKPSDVRANMDTQELDVWKKFCANLVCAKMADLALRMDQKEFSDALAYMVTRG